MEQTVKQRVIEFFEKENITVNSICKTLNIPQKTLNNQINGDSEIGIKTVSAISDLYNNLSADWLLTGRGEMLKSESVFNNADTEKLEMENAMLKREIECKDQMIKMLLDKLSPDVEKNNGSSVRSA